MSAADDDRDFDAHEAQLRTLYRSDSQRMPEDRRQAIREAVYQQVNWVKQPEPAAPTDLSPEAAPGSRYQLPDDANIKRTILATLVMCLAFVWFRGADELRHLLRFLDNSANVTGQSQNARYVAGAGLGVAAGAATAGNLSREGCPTHLTIQPNPLHLLLAKERAEADRIRQRLPAEVTVTVTLNNDTSTETLIRQAQRTTSLSYQMDAAGLCAKGRPQIRSLSLDLSAAGLEVIRTQSPIRFDPEQAWVYYVELEIIEAHMAPAEPRAGP